MSCQNCGRETVPQAKFCNYCGEQVAVACPSCKTSNPPDSLFCSDCGFRLTEGRPLLQETTPESSELNPPLPVVLGCPRCGTANEPGSVYCFQCGLPLDEEPQPRSGASSVSAHAYRSPRTRAIWTSVLLVATVIVDAANLQMTAEVLDLKQRYEAGALTLLSQLAEAETNLNDMTSFLLLVFVATAIAFLLWVYRASRNLRSLGAAGQRFSPGWAVRWWFVPVMFFFRPYQVMAEIWKGSAARASGEATFDWKTESVSALLPWWWGLWIAQYAFGFLVFFASGTGEQAVRTISGMQLALLGDTTEICAAVLAIVLVLQTTKRQDEKHRKMISESSWS